MTGGTAGELLLRASQRRVLLAGFGVAVAGFLSVEKVVALPPGYDHCSNCLSMRSDEPVQGTTLGATGTDVTSCGSGDAADVWYCWRASCTGTASVSFCSPTMNTTAAAFDSCSGSQLGCRATSVCSDHNAPLEFPVDQGTTYVLRIAGVSGQAGNYALEITCEIGCGPSEPSENEPNCGNPTDTVNGGCYSDPPVFSILECGGDVCGTTGGGESAISDRDWYSVSVSGPTWMTLTVTPEFDATTGWMPMLVPGSGDCDGYANVPTDPTPFRYAAPGEVVSVPACLPAGEHWFHVTPVYSTEVCGTPYRASVACVPIDATENEPLDCYMWRDSVNAGCLSEPPAFTRLTCGQDICGAMGMGFFPRGSDTDWFSVVVDGPTHFRWTVRSEFSEGFAAEFALFRTLIPGAPRCDSLAGTIDSDVVVGVDTGSIEACVPAGEHWFVIGPDQTSSVFGCGMGYRATLECGPVLLGDTNCDGAILDDWHAWSMNDCLHGPDQAVTLDCYGYDLDGDGDVDLHDVSLLGRVAE